MPKLPKDTPRTVFMNVSDINSFYQKEEHEFIIRMRDGVEYHVSEPDMRIDHIWGAIQDAIDPKDAQKNPLPPQRYQFISFWLK